MNAKPAFRRSLLEAGSIVLIGLGLGLAYNTFSSRGIDLVRKERQLVWSSDTTRTNTPENPSRATLINIDEAYKIFREGNAIFVDARHEEEFKEGHIKGAISLPLKKLEGNPDLVQGISKDKLIVTYCSGVECELSIDIGEKLASMGFTNVKIFFSGWLDWQKRNLPAETGSKENL
ncbi:MAG: rhodanese-like domain-containing protein [Bacteroidota bacterium]